jgi:hypothetical protein
MRKDSIDQKAIEAAYLIYSERGHEILDYTHAATDYKRNTVEEPETTSQLKQAFGEILPANVMDGDRYDDMQDAAGQLNLQIDSLQSQMRVSRERGSFQQLQVQMRRMQALIKQKEALDARMAVDNLGRKQMGDYNRTMNQEDSYSESINTIGERIAELEAKLLEYREMLEG